MREQDATSTERASEPDTERTCSSGKRRRPIAVRVEWGKGPRTPAWDELWRRLLADVLGDREEPAAVPKATAPDSDAEHAGVAKGELTALREEPDAGP